jgi:hypothetical protein
MRPVYGRLTVRDHDRADTYDRELQHNRDAGLNDVCDLVLWRDFDNGIYIAARFKCTPTKVINELDLDRCGPDGLDR